MHTHKQLTEAELRDEIAKTLDGAVSSFDRQTLINQSMTGPISESQTLILPKRRGRPPGSKNRPKVK